MLKHSWLQALCAAMCVLALTGCGDECADQFDCRNKNGTAPDGKQWTCNAKHSCELQDVTPTEVKCSPTCATSDFCDTSSGEGVCRTCSATQGCAAPLFCDAGANSGKGVCRACSDTATGNAQDQGCSATAPVCDAAAGNGSGVCKACVDSGSGTDVGCTTTAPVCDTTAASGAGVCKACQDSVSGNGQDVGCSAAAPVCDAAGASGSGVCHACQDTANGNAQDLGCSAAAPVCDAAAASGVGVCHACQDTATGNAQDLGCSAAAPVCDAAGASGSGVCHACQDTAAGNAQDLGCSAAAPVCDATAASGVGVCKACVDSATGNGTDLGCTASAPVCNAAAANGAGVCKACLDSATGTAQDLGCSAAAPLCEASAASGAGACRACMDSATGPGTDLGCAAASPLCDTAAASGAGLCRVCMDNASGNGQDVGCGVNVPLCDAAAASGAGACRVCMDNASGGNPDQGCTAPSNFCTASAASGVGACSVCVPVTNEGCPGSQTCNATGTACEGCLDNTSCTNPSTPICKPPPPVAVCVECTDNANCSAARPVCDMATNFCGCTSNAACAAAPGNTDFCDTAANNSRGECRVCVTDANCASVDAAKPFCDNQTACIQCRSNADCLLTQTCDATKACVSPPGADPAGTSAQIQMFIDAPVGMISPALTIENAFVTYIKPALGTDVAGFFLQAQADGPAMFVAVDASSFSLQVGDRITLTVGEVQKLSGDLEAAATVSNVTIVSRGAPVQNPSNGPIPGLAVDRSSASDLQTNLSAYESELISLTGTIASAAASSGTGHTAFSITTVGMTTAATSFRLRVPTTVSDALDIVQGCSFTLKAGPMWRFTTVTGPTLVLNAQPSAYNASDLVISNCPAPKLLSARAPTATEVRLTFDRKLDASSVQASDFSIPSLNITGATSDGAFGVTLTTDAQVANQSYTVTVTGTVTDVAGTAVDPTAKSATFNGFAPPPTGAALVINEVDYDMVGTDNAEYIELYNRGDAPADLTGVVMLLVNGDMAADGPTTQRKEYLRFALSGVKDSSGNSVTSLPAGGYILAASSAYFTSNPPPASTLRLVIANSSGTGTDIVQNGSGDGIGLLQNSTGVLLDSVFYETGTQNSVFRITTGAGDKLLDFVEGTRTTAADSNSVAGSLQRSPNGVDSNNNNTDFAFGAGSPGAANP